MALSLKAKGAQRPRPSASQNKQSSDFSVKWAGAESDEFGPQGTIEEASGGTQLKS